MNRVMLYDIMYALAARDGREAALFGNYAASAREAFAKSLAGSAFPEIWFELPLAGEPWFDLHVLTARETLEPGMSFDADETGGYPRLFAWFARQDGDCVRQLALSYDVGKGDVSTPAAQLLTWRLDVDAVCNFLEVAGRPDARTAYRAFIDRVPDGWFACYTGVFPGRSGDFVRIECVPSRELQQDYARDASLVKEHLLQAGLGSANDEMASRCHLLASMPFQFEFQFDVLPDGSTGNMLGASVRFAHPSDTSQWMPFEVHGPAGELMHHVEAWGLADDRWRLFPDASYVKRAKLLGESCVCFNYPAFVKLRWRDGSPLDAKAYFMAGLQE